MKLKKIPTVGFTIIELLVVIGITMLLSSGLIFYSRTAERQLILFKEQQKIIGALQLAKSLSVSTYNDTAGLAPCAYGVYFRAPDTMIIFKDQPELGMGDDCANANYVYNPVPGGPDEQYKDIIKLDQIASFNILGLSDVIFLPPEPKTIIDYNINSPDGKQEATISIRTSDGDERFIKIANSGQIIAQ